MGYKPTLKEIFDASTGSSIDGCDPDWSHEILEHADKEDVEKIQYALSNTDSEYEAALYLGILH